MFAQRISPSPLLILIIALSGSPVLHAESATAYAPAGYAPHSATASAPPSQTDAEEDDGRSPPECTVNYYLGDAPNFVNPKLATNTTELCFDGFTVMYSGVTRTPLWSAQHLTRARIEGAQTLSRLNNFHEETKLPFDQRATLNDYKGSGYDRGHMSPNGDMGTREQQFNSFSLANIVPQDRYNNQHPWRALEEATRELVKLEGEAYVITGAAFIGDEFRQIGNVVVPSDVFKVVYFPRRQAAGVYFAPNDASNQVEVISLAELNRRIGLDLMPSLPEVVKKRRVDMPLNTTWAQRSSEFTVGQRTVATSSGDHRPTNYGISSNSQLTPAQRNLLKRMWRALWELK